MNKRREIVFALVAGALIVTQGARAQNTKPVVVGWLNSVSRQSALKQLDAFIEGMAALGWKQGSDYVLAEYWGDNDPNRLPMLTAELAARKPAVVVAQPTSSARAALTAMPHTPVVLSSGDAVVAGLVTNLAHPGGRITGLSNLNNALIAKLIEFLLEVSPKSRRLGFLNDSTLVSTYRPNVESARNAAKQRQLETIFEDVGKADEIEPAISRMAKQGAQALIILPSIWFSGERERIVRAALANRWPVAVGNPAFAESGAIIAYGPDRVEMCRRAASFVDKILKGAKPGDLPIEQPIKFDLVVNIKTAKALNIKIPNSVLVQATKVIE